MAVEPTDRFTRSASSPPRPVDGHDAAQHQRRILQSQGAEVIHLGHNRFVDEVVEAAVAEDVQGVAVSCSGRPRRVLRLPGRPVAAAWTHPSTGRRRRHRRRGDRGAAVPRRAHLLPRGRPTHGPGRHGQHPDRRVRRRPDRPARPDRGPARRVRPGTGPHDHHARGRPPRRVDRRADRRRGSGADGAGARNHRHRRLGQVVADRRAHPTGPPRPGRQGQHRGARRRPDPAPRRRGAARRPDPHERHPRPRGVLPVPRHPRRRRRGTPAPGPDGPGHRAAGADLVIVETPASARATRRSPPSPTWRCT